MRKKTLPSSIVIKLVILLLEARRKTENALDVQQKESPEMSGNVYSTVLLWWLNALFWKGQNGLISFSNLFFLTELLCPAGTIKQKEQN